MVLVVVGKAELGAGAIGSNTEFDGEGECWALSFDLEKTPPLA